MLKTYLKVEYFAAIKINVSKIYVITENSHDIILNEKEVNKFFITQILFLKCIYEKKNEQKGKVAMIFLDGRILRDFPFAVYYISKVNCIINNFIIKCDLEISNAKRNKLGKFVLESFAYFPNSKLFLIPHVELTILLCHPQKK